jgi:hypothetical protein
LLAGAAPGFVVPEGGVLLLAFGAAAVRAAGVGFSTMRIGSRSEGSATKLEFGAGALLGRSAEMEVLGLLNGVMLGVEDDATGELDLLFAPEEFAIALAPGAR